VNVGLPASISMTDINNTATGQVIGSWVAVTTNVFKCEDTGWTGTKISASKLTSAGSLMVNAKDGSRTVFNTNVPGIGIALVVADPQRDVWVGAGADQIVRDLGIWSAINVKTFAAYVKTASAVSGSSITKATIVDFYAFGAASPKLATVPMVFGGTTITGGDGGGSGTCTINDTSVNLGTSPASAFGAIGSKGKVVQVPFSIICKGKVNSMNLAFSSATGTVANMDGVATLSKVDGAATGIGVVLLKSDGTTAVKFGAQNQVLFNNDSDGSFANVSFNAASIKIADRVTGGMIKSAMVATLTFN
jgi:major type 1 subunit fimbrin (pilin)